MMRGRWTDSLELVEIRVVAALNGSGDDFLRHGNVQHGLIISHDFQKVECDLKRQRRVSRAKGGKEFLGAWIMNFGADLQTFVYRLQANLVKQANVTSLDVVKDVVAVCCNNRWKCVWQQNLVGKIPESHKKEQQSSAKHYSNCSANSLLEPNHS